MDGDTVIPNSAAVLMLKSDAVTMAPIISWYVWGWEGWSEALPPAPRFAAAALPTVMGIGPMVRVELAGTVTGAPGPYGGMALPKGIGFPGVELPLMR